MSRGYNDGARFRAAEEDADRAPAGRAMAVADSSAACEPAQRARRQ